MLCVADNTDTACCEKAVSFVSQILSDSVALGLDVGLTSYVYYRHISVCNFTFRCRKMLILQLRYHFIGRRTVE